MDTFYTEVLLILREIEYVSGKLFLMFEAISEQLPPNCISNTQNPGVIERAIDDFATFKTVSPTILNSTFQSLHDLLEKHKLVKKNVSDNHLSQKSQCISDSEALPLVKTDTPMISQHRDNLFTFYQNEITHLSSLNQYERSTIKGHILDLFHNIQKKAKEVEYSIVYPGKKGTIGLNKNIKQCSIDPNSTDRYRVVLPKSFLLDSVEAYSHSKEQRLLKRNRYKALSSLLKFGKEVIIYLQLPFNKYMSYLDLFINMRAAENRYLNLINYDVDKENKASSFIPNNNLVEFVSFEEESLSPVLPQEETEYWNALTEGFHNVQKRPGGVLLSS